MHVCISNKVFIKLIHLTELFVRKAYYSRLKCHTEKNALPNLHQYDNDTNPRNKSPVPDDGLCKTAR